MRLKAAWIMDRLPGPFFLLVLFILLLLPPFGCGEGYYYGPYPQLLFLNPLHSDDTLIYEPALIGAWKDDDGESTFSFTGNKDQTAYRLVITFKLEGERSLSIPFTAYLVSLGERMYLDLELKEDELDLAERYRELFFPVHWFYRVDAIGQALILSYPAVESTSSLGSYLWENPEVLDFVIAGSLREPGTPQDTYTEKDRDSTAILITAQTGDLQRFIIEHQGDEDEIIFDESEELVRVKAEP